MEEDGKEKEKSRFQQSDSTAKRKQTLSKTALKFGIFSIFFFLLVELPIWV
jgi:hypothetical protein